MLFPNNSSFDLAFLQPDLLLRSNNVTEHSNTQEMKLTAGEKVKFENVISLNTGKSCLKIYLLKK